MESGVGAVGPHLDDLALSCGTFLATRPGSLMVTAFAGGPVAVDPLPGWDRAAGVFEPSSDVVGARRAEDLSASMMLDASCHHLAHWDGQYRSDTYAYHGPIDEIGLVRAVAADVEALIEDSTFQTWIVPMGLSHPDHVITAAACLALVETHPEVDWLVYEDLPYAVHDPGKVQEAMSGIRSRGLGIEAYEDEMPPDASAKRRLLDCYRSQLKPLGDGVEAAVTYPERFRRVYRSPT